MGGHTLRGCVDWNRLKAAGNAVSCWVTPFVGVWIETYLSGSLGCIHQVTPFVGVWIETRVQRYTTFSEKRHTLRGCVDWNIPIILMIRKSLRHTLRGCVDWNFVRDRGEEAIYGHTLRGCVDWNYRLQLRRLEIQSHTLRGCVDWNYGNESEAVQDALSHPSWVCGLKQR